MNKINNYVKNSKNVISLNRLSPINNGYNQYKTKLFDFNRFVFEGSKNAIYHQCIQSELLSINKSFHLKSKLLKEKENIDIISNNINKEEINKMNKMNCLSLSKLPSLPNYRQSKNKMTINNNNHHPLCSNISKIEENDERLKKRKKTIRLKSEFCVCSEITANINSEFVYSPERALKYQYKENTKKDNDKIEIQSSPLSKKCQLSLFGKKRKIRLISKYPYKILNAPQLNDDFYLNLISWSGSNNILAVGLSDCVYLYNPFNSKLAKLCDLKDLNVFNLENNQNRNYLNIDNNDSINLDIICSVDWNKNKNNYSNIGNNSIYDYLGIGTNIGYVLIYDINKKKLVRVLNRHNHRVAILSFKDSNILSSGSRDRNIYIRDIRLKNDIINCLIYHKQEICGLKWNMNNLYELASGGNDNRLAIWDIRNSLKPIFYGKHRAAIKGISWSPHKNGLLCSGGGTACRSIKIWDIHNNNNIDNNFNLKPIKTIDTGSQVCNIHWNYINNEIITTHGYSLNQIIIWNYPTMNKIATLIGHTMRVLYLAANPSNDSIATGAGDNTLRLWSISSTSKQSHQNYSQHYSTVIR